LCRRLPDNCWNWSVEPQGFILSMFSTHTRARGATALTRIARIRLHSG
jgi:hypothetical protein